MKFFEDLLILCIELFILLLNLRYLSFQLLLKLLGLSVSFPAVSFVKILKAGVDRLIEFPVNIGVGIKLKGVYFFLRNLLNEFAVGIVKS